MRFRYQIKGSERFGFESHYGSFFNLFLFLSFLLLRLYLPFFSFLRGTVVTILFVRVHEWRWLFVIFDSQELRCVLLLYVCYSRYWFIQVLCIQFILKWGNVSLCGEKKTGELREGNLDSRREPTTVLSSYHAEPGVDSNPGHISRRGECSQHCSPPPYHKQLTLLWSAITFRCLKSWLLPYSFETTL